MTFDTELKATLKVTEDENTEVFMTGDSVLCRLKDGRRYAGRITEIGTCQRNKESVEENAFRIQTSGDGTGCVEELIWTADLAFICKNLLSTDLNYPKTNENMDRKLFMDMMTGLGYEEKMGEILYTHMRDIIDMYNIPLSSTLAGTINEVGLHTEGKSAEELIEICNKLMDTAVKSFYIVTDSLRKSGETIFYKLNNQ